MVMRWAAMAGCLLTAGLASGAGAQPSDDGACGAAMSAPLASRWLEMGGAHELGCPTARELAAPTSPQGSDAREVTFASAAIIRHVSGPRAGQIYAVSGCAYRLYFQYGGPGGWLGLPTSDPLNTPDGQKQTFEGGAITFQRALQTCEAERAPTPPAVAGSPRTPLDQFLDSTRADYVAAASAGAVDRAIAAHYQRLRSEGYVFTEPAPGLIPLKLYWNEALGVHEDVATADAERDAQAAGFAFDGAQGFIYADPAPGARPLKRYLNPQTGHSMVTATAEGEADAAAHGFAFDRIEGYIASTP